MRPNSPSAPPEAASLGGSVEPPQNPERLSRRSFARGLLGVVSASVAAAPLLAETETTGKELGPKPEDLSAPEWGEVQARYSNVLRVYGDRLSPEQRHTLGNVLIGNERMLSSIREFYLQNSDPGALTLRLVPQEVIR